MLSRGHSQYGANRGTSDIFSNKQINKGTNNPIQGKCHLSDKTCLIETDLKRNDTSREIYSLLLPHNRSCHYCSEEGPLTRGQ